MCSARVQTQRETLEAREISLRRALQLAAAHEQNLSGKGIQSEETYRALLSIKDDKITALEKCVRDLGKIGNQGRVPNFVFQKRICEHMNASLEHQLALFSARGEVYTMQKVIKCYVPRIIT